MLHSRRSYVTLSDIVHVWSSNAWRVSQVPSSEFHCTFDRENPQTTSLLCKLHKQLAIVWRVSVRLSVCLGVLVAMAISICNKYLALYVHCCCYSAYTKCPPAQPTDRTNERVHTRCQSIFAAAERFHVSNIDLTSFYFSALPLPFIPVTLLFSLATNSIVPRFGGKRK